MKLDPAQFESDVRIDEVNLDASFRGQAGLFAHYAVIRAEAMRVAAGKSILLDVTKAQIDKTIRDRIADEAAQAAIDDPKGKFSKPTETAIFSEVTCSPAYLTARKALIEAEAMEELARNALEAFKQRRDMLIQLGADARHEMSGELRSVSRQPGTLPGGLEGELHRRMSS